MNDLKNVAEIEVTHEIGDEIGLIITYKNIKYSGFLNEVVEK